MIKIPIHSTTDLITNSSTVIFTYSGSSAGAMEEMINEIFKAFGIDKKCADVFDTVVLSSDSEVYGEYLENISEYPEGVTAETDVAALVEDVENGRAPKPDWFKDAESEESQYEYYSPSTYLTVIPKQEEYKKLADLIEKFLYSTHHEATRDG